uniref:NR LBD domain-containing protein n=1 Tax=Caenorhabditis tropicalis TaxID=1561998 RepID=A0A1I7TVS4_9PELO
MTTENVRTDSAPLTIAPVVSEPDDRVAYKITHPRTKNPGLLLDVNAIIKKSRAILETIAIFKIVWAVWRRFERYTMTAEIFGQRCLDEKIMLHSHEAAVRMDKYSIDYSEVSDHGFERFNNVFGGKMMQYYEIIVRPYLELRLSDTEITYILCQIIWNYAGRRLQGQTQAAADRFLDSISNDLHEYYEELGRGRGSEEEGGDSKNYASRLAKMMQIVNQMLNVQLELENTIQVAFLFDMFNIVFTEPEFFRN